MTTSATTIRRTAASVALLAVVAGGIHAIQSVFSRPWVREFQAGARSEATERWLAIGQQTAIEAVGFGLLAAVLALIAVCLTRVRSRACEADEYLASFVIVIAGFVAWATVGTWLGDAMLPFLAAGPLVLLNVAGFTLCVAGFFVFDFVVRRLPWGTPSRVATALASTLCAGAGLWLAREVVTRGTGGYKDPLRLAQAGGCMLAALALAPLLARALAGPVDAIARRLGSGPLLPKPLRYALYGVLAVSVVVAATNFRMSSVPARVDYAKLPARGTPAGPNVIVVTIDTLRADHLGCYGYDRPTSPNIDRVAGEGVVFADPSSPASWTKPATGTILTGLHPSRHGALYHGSQLQLPEGERTLAEAFADSGYVTAGFVSNPNVKRVFLFDRGFDEYFDSPVEDTVTLASIRASWFGRVLMRLARHQFNWKYENDVKQMNRHILAWLEENRDNRFFLYLHYIDPHIPYTPPEPYRTEFTRDHGMALFNERKEKVGIDLYDGEIRYMDEGFQDLVDELVRHGLWDDTLLVITSDHGEEFFEHGLLGHGFSLYQPVVGVPLVFRGPGVPEGLVIDEPVQVLDMPATVLDLAGTGIDRLGDGLSFAGLMRGEAWQEPRLYFIESEFGQNEHDTRSFVFTGVREGKWKLVLTEENAYFPPQNPKYGREALYDLESDPDETVNLFHEEEHRELVERLIAELLRHSQFLQDTGFRDVPPAAMDEATMAELRALGYL